LRARDRRRLVIRVHVVRVLQRGRAAVKDQEWRPRLEGGDAVKRPAIDELAQAAKLASDFAPAIEALSGNLRQKQSPISQLLFPYSSGGGQGVKRGQRWKLWRLLWRGYSLT
jgi:hypothetical protein